ncbi:MAG TPA: hypothetical protein VJI13_04825 [Candidatus Norongarragalinales archaeon]|nr:hypothetical protein [Candidatus Norongarragalinales archaeon]
MNVNEVALYSIIIGGSCLVFLEWMAHRQQKLVAIQLRATKDRLVKLSKLVEDIEKVEHEMHKAAVDKVDRRNLEMIMRETLEFLGEKRGIKAGVG